MATRKPLVIVAGRVQELPVGDDIGITGGTPTVEDMDMYSKRVDFINDNLLYKGEANAGSLESASVWRIRRVEIGLDGDVTETFADGNANFDNAWTDRITKVYS
jgi:hypothetical protein